MEITNKLIDIFKEYGHDRTMKAISIVTGIQGNTIEELQAKRQKTENPKLLALINSMMISRLEDENREFMKSLSKQPEESPENGGGGAKQPLKNETFPIKPSETPVKKGRQKGFKCSKPYKKSDKPRKPYTRKITQQ